MAAEPDPKRTRPFGRDAAVLPPATHSPGTVLADRYELVALVAAGAMAEVYRAWDREAHRDVAVKVPHAHVIASAGSRHRFAREAELARSVSHPSLVRFEADHRTHDPPFLVLEYVRGCTIDTLITDLGSLPEPLVLHVALQAAGALAELHAAGIVHRDLKPENLIITNDHELKVLDLGVAHLLEPSGRITHARDFIGTPSYAAPEQFDGGPVGPATDLYSLGVVSYQAATGINPFDAESLYEIMRRHREHVPIPPGDVRSPLSSFFDQLVGCLLEKRPEQRFASAAELATIIVEGAASRWWRDRHHSTRRPTPRGLPRPETETPFVGRAEELAALRECWREAAEGCSRIVFVEGEAGVGKSRLLRRFVQGLASSPEAHHVLHGSCAPGAVVGSPNALAQAVTEHVGADELEARLPRLLDCSNAMARAFAEGLRGRADSGTEAGLDLDVMSALFCRFARRLAESATLTWIVEDLQFASADACALAQAVARAGEGHRMLVILTCRSEDPPEILAELQRLDRFRRTRLGPLAPDEVSSLAAGMLGMREIAPDLTRLLSKLSDGIPYFVRELVVDLAHRGDLEQVGSGAVTLRPGTRSLPDGLSEMALRRVADVGEASRQVLDVAAVSGHEFDPTLVADVLDRKLLDVLQALASLERTVHAVRATEGGFRFDHHVLQESVYEALPPRLRKEYHSLLAASRRRRLDADGTFSHAPAGEAHVFLAWHYLKAGDDREGASWLLPALDHFEARCQHVALLELVELALTVIADDEIALRCRVRLKQAESCRLLGRGPAGEEAIADAVRCATLSGDERLMLDASRALGLSLITNGEPLEASEILRDAEARARQLGDEDVLGPILGLLATASMALGDYGRARELAEEQLELLRTQGDLAHEAAAIGTLGLAHWYLGDRCEARRCWEAQLANCSERRDAPGEAQALGNLAVHAAETLGEHGRARELLERQLGLARDAGLRRLEARAHANLGALLQLVGEPSRVHVRRHLELSREIGDRKGVAVAVLNLGLLELEGGRLASAAEHLRSAADSARDMGALDLEAQALLGLCDVARGEGNTAQARDSGRKALAGFRELGDATGVSLAALSMARVDLDDGKEASAERWLDEAAHAGGDAVHPGVGSLPDAYLALMGRRDARDVAVIGSAPIAIQAEIHLVLHRAGAGDLHLERGRQLVERLASHVARSEQERFWQGNALARMLRAIDADGVSDAGGP